MQALRHPWTRFGLALLVASGPVGADDPPAPLELETPHYRIVIAGGDEDELDELALVLEAARPLFAEELGFAPGDRERATIRVLPDVDAWLARIRLEGGEPPAGERQVWVRLDLDTVYVARDATPWHTRQRVLHGALQHFHARAKAKHEDLLRSWYVLGLAAHLAEHRWDGKRLELGVLSLLSSEDYPARALELVDPASNDPDRALDRVWDDPAMCFGLVRFVSESASASEQRRFRKLALGRSGSKLTGTDYARALGDSSEVAARMLRWLVDHQQPLQIVWGHWNPIDDTRLEAWATPGTLALCVLKHSVEELRVTLEPGPHAAGIVFDFVDEERYLMAALKGKWLEVLHVTPEGTSLVESLYLRRDSDGSRWMKVTLEEDVAVLTVEGHVYARLPVTTARMGLAAAHGTAGFRDVGWR